MAWPPSSPRFSDICLIHSLTSLTLSTIRFPRFISASGSILRILPTTLAGILGSRLDHLLTTESNLCFCHGYLKTTPILYHNHPELPINTVLGPNGPTNGLAMPVIVWQVSPTTIGSWLLKNTVVLVCGTNTLCPGAHGAGMRGLTFVILSPVISAGGVADV